MNKILPIAVCALAALPSIAQDQRSGVSNPEPVVISAQPDEAAPTRPVPAKPSAAIPAEPESTTTPAHTATPTRSTLGTVVPYRGSSAVETTVESAKVPADPDAEIVTTEVDRRGEIREGTIIRSRIKQGLSTVSTVPGTDFTAELTEPVEKDGKVVIPVGALISGRVTEVHGGRRISGAALMHLEAKSITLPDGTRYLVHAQLIDTDQTSRTKVDREGTLIRKDHPRETLAAIGLASGGAAAAGGVMAGGVGAAVGASIGAGAGTIWWLKQDRQTALPAESLLVFTLIDPLPLTPAAPASVSSLVESGVPPANAVATPAIP